MMKFHNWQPLMNVLLIAILLLSPLRNANASTTTQQPPTVGFIALSDIHFDPFAGCHAARNCPLVKALMATPWHKWDPLFQQYAITKPNGYKSDSNDALLLSTLHDLQQRQLQPRFVLIPGDFLAHDMVEHYKYYSGDQTLRYYPAFINKIFFYLSDKLKQTFPNTPIYPVIGNNDSYHGDYYSDPNGPFYRFLSQNRMWGQFFIDSGNQRAFKRQFTVGGYYKITTPGHFHQRILVLNTVLFSTHATGHNIKKAATNELNWLTQQLQLAQRQRQKVWLVFHIPYGVDVYTTIKHGRRPVLFWRNRYNQQFLELLNNYHDVIQAVITGHLHMDGFQYTIIPSQDKTVIDTFIPGISPLFGNNPAYKYYHYHPDDFTLTDFTTYYLDLANANPRWRKEYDFNAVYQPDCHNCLLAKGMIALQKQGNSSNHYRHYYAVSTHAQPISEMRYWPLYWCGIHHQALDAFNQCRHSETAVKSP